MLSWFFGAKYFADLCEKSSLEPQLENNTHAPTPLHPVFCGSLRAYGLSGLKTLQLVRMQFDRKQNQIGE